MNAIKIASPPSRGIIRLCTLRWFGASTALAQNAKRLTSGVITKAINNAAAKPIPYNRFMRIFTAPFFYENPKQLKLYSEVDGNSIVILGGMDGFQVVFIGLMKVSAYFPS
ncbi:hypothetical protein B2K_00400 [Paenibacillus mucilaginosus K02]|uniref:Uncharacterized protein n=2 Tax=Paenibacillus mucilaginosus TaxID=61624 RepID=I0BA06_9BACL|nr:hypothetical protein B2K_00400 [Paenibacillus mucilaginosus K02]